MTRQLEPLTLPLWGSRLIEASAGTGKTWTIAALYLRLVLGHGDASAHPRPLSPAEILVTTFTRAATRELSDRIRTRLVEAAACFRGERAIAADDRLLQALVAAYPAGAAREHAAWRLATAAESMDDAAVSTIDAWVQRMLREHAFDSGCLFDEEVQPDERALMVEAAQDYWRQEVYPLRGEALAGVLSVWKDLDALVRDLRRLKGGFDREPAASLAETWRRGLDRRAADLERLKAPWVGWIDHLRRWFDERLGPDGPFDGRKVQRRWLEPWFQAIDRWLAAPLEDALSLPPGAVRRLSPQGLLEGLRPECTIDVPPWSAALGPLLAALPRVADPSHGARLHAAARVAARIRDQKRGAGLYGFDDMLERLDDALAGPSGERLRSRIVAQFPAALIDEFQDTSTLQYRLFDRLYRTADNDPATALLLIGDPKQSIYGFRGADIGSYLRARAAMVDRHYFLTTNYRSTAPLVAAINHLFANAEPVEQGAFRFGASPPAARETAGAADDASPLPFLPVAARGRRETLRDGRGPIAALTLCHDALIGNRPEAQRRFAEHAAERIVVLLDDPATGFDDPLDGFRRLQPADITVLVRTGQEAVAIRRALHNRRVPSVYLSDRDSVFASPEAADLLHWLRAVADPFDVRRARVAFATALVGLSLDEIARLGHDDIAFERRVDDLKALHADWRRQGLLPMLRRSLHRLELPARWLGDADGERKLTNVLHLAELLQAASARLDGEQAVIRWFAERLADDGQAVEGDEQVVRLESDAELVRVVTIHKAKGLEYPVVFLPFVSSYRERVRQAGDVVALPDARGERRLILDVDEDARRLADLQEDQEDVRLLYVALTRARHALWLGVAPLKDGRTQDCGFHRSAFGYLASGGTRPAADEIGPRLHAVFDGLPSVDVRSIASPAARTRLATVRSRPPLVEAPPYDASFERDWSIGSFSAFVRDLARLPLAAALVDPAVEEELRAAPLEHEAAATANAPRHRFPRGALSGNFLHDQLEWLAAQRFALVDDPVVRDQLARRCDRQGWGARAGDVVTWLSEVVATPLPPIGRSLDALESMLPEMEFWFPSDGLDARRIDALCRRHLLDGRDRTPLPDRRLRGMLMGFADLVVEVDGRYWVLDYKSNALGPDDGSYTADALARSMAEHRYDVQAAIYLSALHRLLRQRLGSRYDPDRQLGGALYLFLRGIRGPVAGCCVVPAGVELLDGLDEALGPATREAA